MDSRYEYKCVAIGDPSRAAPVVEEVLNAQAIEGWRLVTVVVGRYGMTGIFERQTQLQEQVVGTVLEQPKPKRKRKA